MTLRKMQKELTPHHDNPNEKLPYFYVETKTRPKVSDEQWKKIKGRVKSRLRGVYFQSDDTRPFDVDSL